MTNGYFNHDAPLARHTLARAEELNAKLTAVAAGFDRLPSEAVLKQGRTAYGAATGTADSYAITLPYAPTAYTEGMRVTFRVPAGAANAGPSAVNVNGLGVKPVLRIDGTPVTRGDLPSGGVIDLCYDGTAFRLVGAHGGDVAMAHGYAGQAADSANAATISAINATGAANAASISAAGAAESARAAAASAAGVNLPPVTAADAGKVLTATTAGALTLQAPGVAVQVNSGPGSAARPAINLIAGAGVEFVMTDNPSANRVDVIIVAARPVTLDPGNRGADVRLSADWLTATPAQASTARGGCRATIGRSEGKFYFECEGGWREETGVGFVASTVDVSAVDVSAVTGACLIVGYPNGDKIVRAGGVTYPLSGETPYGDKRTGIACDIGARKWWRRVNGVWQDGGNPTTGANSLPGFPSGVVYPLIRIRNFPGETLTLRFHAQTWQDPAPAGFSQWG